MKNVLIKNRNSIDKRSHTQARDKSSLAKDSLWRVCWKGFKKGWMKFAHVLGIINTTILLSIFYFVLVGIYAIIVGLPKKLIQVFKKHPSSYWINHKQGRDIHNYKYPF